MAARLDPQTLFPDVSGPEFLRAEDVAEVAADVLRDHQNLMSGLAAAVDDGEVHVLYLRNDKPFDPVNEDVTHDVIAKAAKAPRLWRDVTGFEAVVWVRSYFWDQFDPRQRRALVLHELLHFEVAFDTKGRTKLGTRPHDIEEHRAVVRHYGDWLPDVASFARAYGLWQADGGKADDDEPTPLRPDVMDKVIDAVVDAANAGVLGPGVTASRGGRKTKPAADEARADDWRPKVGDPIVVDGSKLRIKTIDSTHAYAKASFGDERAEVELVRLGWDGEAGVWRVAEA